MRLLVTGSHGQVARCFLEAAPAKSGITACAIGRPALDICSTPTIERAIADIKPDVIINTAAYTAVDDAEGEPERAHALNCEGARLMSEAANRRGVPIIHISTDYVFDGLKSSAYRESDATAPASVYGRTKLDGERAVAAANPKHIILRTAWVYSPYGKNFVKTILNNAAKGNPLRVVDDQIGSPTYAPHLVEAILAIAEQITGSAARTDAWGVYHAAGQGTASWFEVAREILSQSKELGGSQTALSAIGSDGYPTRAVRPKNSILDCGKMKRVFGAELPPWQTGVALCVKRLLDQPAA
jgi:dTDP-4-dehydrorhamnose reductase